MCFEMIAKPTPTLLRTLAWDGTPRVHVKVDVGRCEDFHGIGPYLVRGIPELLLVAHAGSEYSHPVLVDESVYAALEKLIPLAPLHQPHNLAAIRAVRETQPQLPQVACFDTAFHRTHPHLAWNHA